MAEETKITIAIYKNKENGKEQAQVTLDDSEVLDLYFEADRILVIDTDSLQTRAQLAAVTKERDEIRNKTIDECGDKIAEKMTYKVNAYNQTMAIAVQLIEALKHKPSAEKPPEKELEGGQCW